MSHGTNAASLTQSFSGSNFPYGNTKSSIRSWLLSLYICSASLGASFFPSFLFLPYTYYTIFLLKMLVFH